MLFLKPKNLVRALIGIGFTVAALQATPFGQEPPANEDGSHPLILVAQDYIDAYCAMDQERLATFLTDTSTWRDPTSKEIGASSGTIRGAKAILQHLKQSVAGMTAIEFDVEDQFASGDYVLSRGQIIMSFEGATFQKPGREVVVELPMIMALEIRQNKILEHIDYTDFRSYREQIREQLR